MFSLDRNEFTPAMLDHVNNTLLTFFIVRTSSFPPAPPPLPPEIPAVLDHCEGF